MSVLEGSTEGDGIRAERPLFPTQMPFVGRIREVDTLTAMLDGARNRCVLLSGAPGVGKSRLAATGAQRAVADGVEVVTVTATTAFSEIPFGSLAPLLGALERGDAESRGALGQTEFLALAYDAVSERLQSSVLIVDDVHLLDAGSALLLSFLITAEICPIVLTTRDTTPLPHPVERLWMDGAIDSMEIEPLPGDDIAALCSATLGGPVETRTALRLDQACAGNLLYLRELLQSGLTGGQLAQHGGPWRWEGRLTMTGRLTELISARLLGASPAVTRLLRFVSLAEPLPLRPLVSLCDTDAVEQAEALGYLLVVRDGRRTVARLAHPLYGEVLRDLGGRAESRRLASELAVALAEHGLRRTADTLRLAVLEMRSGTASDPDRLVSAATRARLLGNLELAEQLARAAVDVGGSGRARLELLECLFWQGRADEAPTVVGDLDPASLDLDDTVQLAVYVASIQFFSERPLAVALHTLDDAEHQLGDDPRAERIRAHRAELLMFSGDVEPATEIARDILSRQPASVLTRGVAYGALAPSLALRGRVEEARAVSDEGLAVLLADPDPPLADGAGIVVGGFLAGLFGCRLDESTQMIESLRSEALRHPADPMLSVWSLLLGRARVGTGPLGTATELLTEAVVQLRAADPSRLLAWALGSLAQTLGMTGDAVAALAAVAEMDVVRDQNIGAFALDRDLGRAWAASADGRPDDARRIVTDAATAAIAKGAYGTAAYAIFEAFRLGVSRSVLQSLWEPDTPLEGPLLPLAVSTATGRTEPVELLARAEDLRVLGAHLWAGDTAAIACSSAHSAGLGAVAARAQLWLDTHRGDTDACTPAIVNARLPARGSRLTTRERDLIRLVVAGRTNQEIAVALYISRRTVESHLHNIFKKLGVSSREELAAPFEAPTT